MYVRIEIRRRQVCVSLVALRKEKVYHTLGMRVCILGYPACKAHAPYNNLSSVLPYKIFPHNLKKGPTF